MLKDRLHELLGDSEGEQSRPKTDDVTEVTDEDKEGRENEAFDDEEKAEGEKGDDKGEDKSEDKKENEKKPEEKLKPKKTKEQTEVDIEELERKKAEEKALEEFIEDHKLPEDLGKFLDDIGSVLR